ncbi:MAG: hypothetical protein COB15_04320 [Flavobacteriales bacterium]|nr:MAG: hypothetical protein COB15_04320 [Flavobacteriales bacterium]
MKNIIKLNKKRLLSEAKNYGFVLLGAVVLSLGYSLFIVPQRLVPGGVFGLSIVAFELVGLSVGLLALIINIPLLLWGAKTLGKKAALKTAFFMISSSFFIDGIIMLTNSAIIVDDVLVSGIFGGLLVGTSIFITKIGGATTGGSDIVARILSEKVNLQFSHLLLIMDAFVVVLGIITFKDYTMAAYCIITIVTTSKTIGHYAKKNEESKTVLVFSENNALIHQAIKDDDKVKEEVIKLIHNRSDDKLVLVTKNGKRLNELKQLIYKTDSKSHVLTLESS